MDYQSLLFDPVYDVIGVEAQLVVAAGEEAKTVTVIDKTAGIAIDDGSGLLVQTVLPGATLRMAELTARGLTRADCDSGSIAFNDKTWRIKATQPRPSPKGEADGELLLILMEEPA